MCFGDGIEADALAVTWGQRLTVGIAPTASIWWWRGEMMAPPDPEVVAMTLAHASRSTHAPAPGVAPADRQQRRAELRAQQVRIQWDPKRDLRFRPLDHRSIQIGLSGEAVDRYVDEWIVAVNDLTGLAQDIGTAGDLARAAALLPAEEPYPLPAGLGPSIAAGDEETDDA